MPVLQQESDGGDLGCRYTPEMIDVLQSLLFQRRFAWSARK
ncbi:MAG TPA: hypothetical protein VMY37_02510 [Thermoguttaceae bacterium]|nr:hypothetical protein [Thermoguttaceae bacterium]